MLLAREASFEEQQDRKATRGTSKLHLGPLPVFPFLEPGERDSVPSSSNPGKALYTLDELATSMYQGGCSKRGITRTLETFGGKVFSRLGFPDHGSCGGEKRDGENDQFEGGTPSSSSWGVPQGPKGYRAFRSGNAFLGIDDGGYREVLGFWTSGSDAESSLSWKETLFSLKERGLTEPLLVVGDGLQDLREAVQEVYPEAQFQSDLVHKTRNVLRKVRKRDERAVLEDVKKMYAASSLEEFQEHFETFKKNWKHLYPEEFSRERDLPYLTTHLGYPTLLQQHIRTRTL
jgi:hypothetical protein